MIDSDTESENETHSAGEYAFASFYRRVDWNNISRKLKTLGVSATLVNAVLIESVIGNRDDFGWPK